MYVPTQYVAGTASPFIITQDGGGYVETLIPALDTLIHEKRVPVMAAILIDQAKEGDCLADNGDILGIERLRSLVREWGNDFKPELRAEG